MRNIITLEGTTNTTPMFGGNVEGSCFLRTDESRHRVLRDLWESSLALFWTVNMVDFSKDAEGFAQMPKHAQRMFKLNNGYQSLMDSGVVSIYNHLALQTNHPEIALSYTQIMFTETIHATSYSDGLLEMFGSDATSVIDIVKTDPIVRTRLDDEIDYSYEMIENPSNYNIFRAIAATYLLEYIKFPFSFFVTLTLNKGYNNAINGFSQLIARISQEELEIHVPTNKYILKKLIENHDLPIEEIKSMADRILEQELQWNKYLQLEGPVPGYNEAIGEEFLRYYHNKALRDIGYKDIETIKPSSTIDWFNHARNPDNKQVSQQEMKSTQYQKGVIKNDFYKFKEQS